MANKKPFTKINSNGRHLTKVKYDELMEQLNQDGKKSEEFLEIQTTLENESDFYMLNEYELALLTGEKVNALRDNRRRENHRWYFVKGNQDNKSKVLYPMKAVRENISAI